MANLDQIMDYLADHTYTGYGTGIDIGGYTSQDFTVPSNGIIRATARYYAGSYAGASSNNNVILSVAAPTSQNAASNMVSECIVFKGQTLRTNHSATNSSVWFYPFV